MSKILKNVESTVKTVLPIERDEKHIYIRSNITRIDEPDTDKVFGRHCWVYDEEILTHNEYTIRLEEQLVLQKEENLNALEGIAELYEALCAKEVL